MQMSVVYYTEYKEIEENVFSFQKKNWGQFIVEFDLLSSRPPTAAAADACILLCS